MYTRHLRGLRPLDTKCTSGLQKVRDLQPEYTYGSSARIHAMICALWGQLSLKQPFGCLIDLGRYTWLLGFGVSWGLLLDKSKYDWEQTWDFDRANFRHEITEHNFTLASL